MQSKTNKPKEFKLLFHQILTLKQGNQYKINILNMFNAIQGKNIIQGKGIMRFLDSFDKVTLNARKKVNQKLRFSRILVELLQI